MMRIEVSSAEGIIAKKRKKKMQWKRQADAGGYRGEEELRQCKKKAQWGYMFWLTASCRVAAGDGS
jgi:hypothetical protein